MAKIPPGSSRRLSRSPSPSSASAVNRSATPNPGGEPETGVCFEPEETSQASLNPYSFSRRKTVSTLHALPTSEVEGLIQSWQFDGESRMLSERTLIERGFVVTSYQRFIENHRISACDAASIRRYLTYVRSGSAQAQRTVGNTEPRPVRPRTVYNHWSYLRTFFNWLVEQGYLEQTPFIEIKPPLVPQDPVQPLTTEQLNALVTAAKRSNNARRNVAIVYLLWDTGMRASELCSLRVCDIDIHSNACLVLGKGNKVRVVHFGSQTKKAVWEYVRHEKRDEDDFLFLTTRGKLAGEPMNRDGLRQLIERLGTAARISGVRCSPHTLRHTFAVQFLRNGGNVFSLQMLLGHSDLAMTRKYVNLAQADLAEQHRRYSPVDQVRVRRTQNIGLKPSVADQPRGSLPRSLRRS